MKMTTAAKDILQRLADEYAAAGFESNWVFEAGPRREFSELIARGLIEPTGADEIEYCFTPEGLQWVLDNHADAASQAPMPHSADVRSDGGGSTQAPSILDDATQLLLFMSETGEGTRKGHGTVEAAQLVGPLDMSPDRLNDAIDIMDEGGLVEVGRYLGTAPFNFKDARLTPRGRLQAQHLRAQSAPLPVSSPSRSGVPTHTPRVERTPTPVGSPFGFQDEDWESVDRDQNDSERLIVVFGHQWESQHFDSEVLRAHVRAMMQKAIEEATADIPGRPSVALDYRPLKAGYGSHVFNEIARDIIGADIAILDTSDNNPNVMIELGVALTWGRRVLPIREESTRTPPSDISGQTWSTYRDSGARWSDPNHSANLRSLVARAIRKKLATTGR